VEKLRILQLVPRFPFPADDGGKIGIANIIKEFSKQNAQVTLFSLGDEDIPQEAIAEAKQYADLVLVKHNTSNTKKRIVKSLLFNHSIYIQKHSSLKVKKKLKELLKTKKFDIIHSDHTCMAPLALYAKKIQSIPIGLRLHNIEWLIWKRYADNLSFFSPKRFYIEYQASLLKDAEKRLISKMDINFAITENDMQQALKLSPKANIIVASAGVNSDEWKPDDNIERNPSELILATTYRWIHNVDALKWFIAKVLPIVKNEISDVKLTLIGKNPPQWLNSFEHLGINTLGYVDKVQPYLNRANIYIAPLFVGGGIRIKILEAMAMELPVVATSVSAEGINANEENGLYIADNVSEFAETIINLFSDENTTRLAGKKAREFVQQNFSWKKNVGIMLDEYRKLLK